MKQVKGIQIMPHGDVSKETLKRGSLRPEGAHITPKIKKGVYVAGSSRCVAEYVRSDMPWTESGHPFVIIAPGRRDP